MTITDRDKRTIRIASIGLAIYLVLFFGFRAWKGLEQSRAGFQTLVKKVESEQIKAREQENDLLRFEKLRDEYRLDPRNLPKETLVAEAAAAIQDAARQGGFALTSIRENDGRPTARELSTIQLDGMGQVEKALNLIHTLQTLGYPVVIDSLQLTQESNKPGMLKMNLVVVILNFDFWQKGTTPNA